MRINTNIMALDAYRNLNNTNDMLSSSLEKLSSGYRINRAADDASGLVDQPEPRQAGFGPRPRPPRTPKTGSRSCRPQKVR